MELSAIETLRKTPIGKYIASKGSFEQTLRLMRINDWEREYRKGEFCSGDNIIDGVDKTAKNVEEDDSSVSLGVKKYKKDGEFRSTQIWNPKSPYKNIADAHYSNEKNYYGGNGNFDYRIDFIQNDKKDIISKTSQLFENKKIKTIISRYYTGLDPDEGDATQTAKTKFGMSHGRNLLTFNAENTDNVDKESYGYKNPYCRVWTHHHTYSELRENLIRPFINDQEDTVNSEQVNRWENFEDNEYVSGGIVKEKTGTEKEKKQKWGWRKQGVYNYSLSVLDSETGTLNIAPKHAADTNSSNIHPKDCMFSIENLAWQGYDPYSFERALSWEQRGPFGGRIMWFPPYGLRFSEESSVQWNEHTFIGRGENVFTYTNTSRSGTLEFMMVVDHPSIIDYATWYQDKTQNLKDTDILRFFAGCNTGDKGESQKFLQAFAIPTPLTDEYVEEEPQNEPDPEPQMPPLEEAPPEEEIKISVYAFFPNNYSGYFDNQQSNGGKVDPISYLLYGNGAQWVCDEDNVKESSVLPINFKSVISEISEVSSYGMGYEMKNSISNKENQNRDKNFIIGTNITESGVYYPNEKKKWYYRIDGDYVDGLRYNEIQNTFGQTLKSDSSYSDNETFNLNCNAESVKKSMEIKDEDDETLYSLAELAYVLCKDAGLKNKIIANCGGQLNADRIKQLKSLLNNEITEAVSVGFANNHGSNSNSKTNKDRNEFLAKERAATLFKWFKENYKNGNENLENKGNGENNVINVDKEDNNPDKVSSELAKTWRSAKLTLKIKKTSVKTIDESQQNANQVQISDTQEQQQPSYTSYESFISTGQTGTVNGQTVELYRNTNIHNQLRGIEPEIDNTPWNPNLPHATNNSSYNAPWYKDPGTFNMVLYKNKQILEQMYKKPTDNKKSDRNNLRYDQEYYFFKQLKKDNPDIFEKLVDKLQYFDPAFHSMTPEGFMGRLNFLNQCTRQGDTVGSSDINGKTANNLAFGRPPFCILRLGDFYYQKIVIRNISITYDPLVLDLNQEGIGVVPLIANVTISFNFIGGGDLTGPVRRLQNAMSFNYYANGRLYDNRADQIERKGPDAKAMGAMGNNKTDFAESYFHHVRMAEE